MATNLSLTSYCGYNSLSYQLLWLQLSVLPGTVATTLCLINYCGRTSHFQHCGCDSPSYSYTVSANLILNTVAAFLILSTVALTLVHSALDFTPILCTVAATTVSLIHYHGLHFFLLTAQLHMRLTVSGLITGLKSRVSGDTYRFRIKTTVTISI